MFREIMAGPWETEQQQAANRFLDKRAKTLDVLTSDTARVFFGVDISCAKCHDHPLVDDWSQFLSTPMSEKQVNELRFHSRKGKPAGSKKFVSMVGQKIGRNLRVKPGPRPSKTA